MYVKRAMALCNQFKTCGGYIAFLIIQGVSVPKPHADIEQSVSYQ